MSAIPGFTNKNYYFIINNNNGDIHTTQYKHRYMRERYKNSINSKVWIKVCINTYKYSLYFLCTHYLVV